MTKGHLRKVQDYVLNQLNYYFTQLDKSLSKYEYTNTMERWTGVPKPYLLPSLIILFFIMVIFDIGGQVLSHVLGFVYPGYRTFKAIEGTNKEDEIQWLTYWVVIGFGQSIGYVTNVLLSWLPFYNTLKTLMILWLILPQFKGAQVIYRGFLRLSLLYAESLLKSDSNRSTFFKK